MLLSLYLMGLVVAYVHIRMIFTRDVATLDMS